MAELSIVPIGVVRSPFRSKRCAPRQSTLGSNIAGTLELYPDSRYLYALHDLEAWSHIWVLFWFHLNDGWRSKVRPPRSVQKRGVFATRAPHRPNPIGMSVLKLERIEGLVLHVRGLDILDGSPILDIKPYVPYADIVPEAAQGWLADLPDVADEGPRYSVAWAAPALERIAWLEEQHGVSLRHDVEQALALGTAPHPYRRIKREGQGLRLALGDWRLPFTVADRSVTVLNVQTGYRARALRDPNTVARGKVPLEVHRAFLARFG